MMKFRLSGVMAMSLLLIFSFLALSCVNEEYDMSEDNLNLEVTPFEDGLTLPLGSTDPIKLKELLKDVDSDILGVGEGGAYSVSFSDSFDMTEQLSSLKSLIEIPDVDFSQKVNFQMNDVDVSDIKVEARDYTFDYELAASVNAPELTLPSFAEKFEVAAGLASYVPDASQFELSFKPISHETHFMSLSDDFHLPESQINDIPIPVDGGLLDNYLNTSAELDFHETVPLKISLPAGISSVDDVILHEGAAMKVTIALKGNFLHSGKLIPEVDVDLHDIFHLDENHGGDVAHLVKDFVLSEENGYSQTKTYGISSLAIASDDWTRGSADEGLVLDKKFDVSMAGEIVFQDLMTTTRHIENDRNIDIVFDIEFVNLLIDDVVMGIDPIEIRQESTLEMSLDNFEIPAEIEEITDVTFTPQSGLDIVVKAQNLEKVKGLAAGLESLEVIFPEELSVEGADAGNKVTISNVDLSKGVTRHVAISAVDLPAPKSGKIDFSKDIKVKAVAKASGKVHSASLPADAADDVKVLVDVKSALEVADYNMKMAGSEFELDIKPESIKVEMPESIADMDKITVYPEGNPAITISFDIPELPLDLTASAEGLRISFPEILRFKKLPSEYNYDLASNSVTLRGAFPSEITLPIEKLVLAPVKDPADGKYYAQGELNVKGGVSLASGLIGKDDLETLSKAGKITVTAHVPELVPSTLSLDSFETSLREEVALEILSAEDVPAELVSIDKIELNETYVNLSLDASSLPELGDAELTVELEVDFPDIIKVHGTDDSGNLTLKGSLDEKGMIVIDPIRVDALDLSGVDIRNGIKDVITVDGKIRLSNISLDVDEWLDKDLEIGFKAGLTDIDIAKISGKVNYQVDPVVETVDLSDVAEALGDLGAEANLDFYHAHLAVEVATNLGVPVEGNIVLVPYYDGKADTGKTVTAAVAMDPSESPDVEKVTRLWIADNDDRCPSGYRFVQADILGLLKHIPEKLEFRLDAGTDPERESVLEPSAAYTLKANYLFELPLEFGEEFEVTYRTEVSDVPEIVGTLLNGGSKVKLAGEITNSLPLGLDLTLNLLDPAGNIVPLAEGCGVQKIAPCNLDASASKTELGVVLALNEGVKADISSIELVFKANSAGAVGIPVTEDAYLQAMLQLVFPEGISLDLKDVMNKE